MIMSLVLLTAVMMGCKTAKNTTQSPPTSGVQQLTIKATPCYGTCPVFEMTVRSDKSANYLAQRHNNGQQGLYRAVIDGRNYEQLIALLMATDFPNLKEEYTVGATDLPSMDLEITYEGSKVKKIHDYGARGTDELKALYDFVKTLRETQQWQRME